MNYVYGHWTPSNFAQKGGTVKSFDKVGVTDGKSKSVSLVAGETINPIVPFNTDGTANQKVISISYDQKKTKTIEAPVQQGQKVATVSMSIKDQLGYLPGSSAAQFSLLTKNSVEKSSPLKVFWNHFVIFVNEKL